MGVAGIVVFFIQIFPSKEKKKKKTSPFSHHCFPHISLSVASGKM